MKEGAAARGLAPILPSLLAPHQGAIQLDENYWVHKEHFNMQPGVLDTNTIDMLRVSARILSSSILLRDESQYF